MDPFPELLGAWYENRDMDWVARIEDSTMARFGINFLMSGITP